MVEQHKKNLKYKDTDDDNLTRPLLAGQEKNHYSATYSINTTTDNGLEDTNFTQQPPNEPEPYKTPLYAYLILVLCGASGAMDGPFSQFLTTRNPFLRMSWKFQGVLFLLIMIYLSLRLLKSGSINLTRGMTKEDLVTLTITSIGLIGMQSFLTWGATYTIMAHANLYSSLCSIMIVAWRLSRNVPVTKYEIIGSVIALGGCVVTTFDPSAQKTLEIDNQIQFGNLLSFFSSVFATFYILKGQEVSTRLSSLQYLIFLTAIACIFFYTVFPLAYFGTQFNFTTDINTGIFGWLAPENFWYNLLVVSGLNGVGTLTLQMLVFRYFTPVVAGTMMLLEPLFS